MTINIEWKKSYMWGFNPSATAQIEHHDGTRSHVGPFTCMQEGVATAKIEAMAKELSQTKPDLVFPIIHAFFGDSSSANLNSEIAVFTEQCYQKRDMLKAEPKT